MGEIRTRVTLENSYDREMVDRGAVTLVIPKEVANELGLRRRGTRTVVYADERRDQRPVGRGVTIEIGSLTTESECIIGPAGSEVLIGQVVLEALDLIADSTNRTVTPRRPEGPVLALRRAG